MSTYSSGLITKHFFYFRRPDINVPSDYFSVQHSGPLITPVPVVMNGGGGEIPRPRQRPARRSPKSEVDRSPDLRHVASRSSGRPDNYSRAPI